jgi:hypothetical protein
MKNKIKSLVTVAVIAAGILLNAKAQTPPPSSGTVSPPFLVGPATDAPPVPTAGSFFGSVQSYFTSFNTNLDSTFSLERGEAWAGVDSIQGGAVPLANCFGLSYNVYSPTPAGGTGPTTGAPLQISVESITRNSGVAGIVVSQAGGVGLSFIVHDAKLTLYADGVYNLTAKGGDSKLCAEIGLRAKKALTEHTFAFIGVGAQLPKNAQVFSAGAGFTF